MRHEAQITSLSWIPSEAIGGLMRKPFDSGFTHYDEPPPGTIGAGTGELVALRDADRFRFANVLQAWIVVEDGRIVDAGYGDGSGSMMGSTTVQVPGLAHTFEAVALPDLRRDPDFVDGGSAVRFVQTCGGRTGLPAPRRVRRKPFIQWRAPFVWSTLALTLRADGTSSFEVVGASRFPRHWVFGPDGNLAAKTGLADFKNWYRRAFGKHTPWGDEESEALVTAVETALERELSTHIMQGGAKPKVRRLKDGATFAREGEEADELFLVLDGVVRAEKDGERLAEYGPGALLGERASLEGGRRTATLVAVTRCKIAVASACDIEVSALQDLATGHRHEERIG